MNILGMGFLELLVIFVIGFIILGPEKMLEMAQKAGQLVVKLRSMSAELQEAIAIDEADIRPEFLGGPAAKLAKPDKAAPGKAAGNGDEAPVSFQAEGGGTPPDVAPAPGEPAGAPDAGPTAELAAKLRADLGTDEPPDDPPQDGSPKDDETTRGGLNGVAK